MRGAPRPACCPVVATKPEPASRERAAEAHGEAYWRREAETLATRLRPLRREADALRAKIASARRTPAPPAMNATRSPRGTRGRRITTPAPPAARDTRLLEDQLRALEREIRERESALEERARKERALPGWLR